jgi:hypothetical protein
MAPSQRTRSASSLPALLRCGRPVPTPAWYITVCGSDWLIIGYVNADEAIAAMDVRDSPSEWKVSAQTALSAFRLAGEFVCNAAGTPDGMLSVMLRKTGSYAFRVLLLNTTVAVDPVTGVRALTFLSAQSLRAWNGPVFWFGVRL